MRRTNDDHKWTERAQHEHQHHQPTHPMDPNPWLVDELYDLFRDDPSAVGPSWHEFFADYQPSDAEAAEPVGPTARRRRRKRSRRPLPKPGRVDVMTRFSAPTRFRGPPRSGVNNSAPVVRVPPPTPELPLTHRWLTRTMRGMVSQVVLVGTLADDAAQHLPRLASRAVQMWPEPACGHCVSLGAPACASSRRCSRSCLVGMSPDGAHSCERTYGSSAPLDSGRPDSATIQTRMASTSTTTTSPANSAVRAVSSVVLNTTCCMSSTVLAVPRLVFPASSASWYWVRCAQKPIFGSAEKIFC